MTHRKNHSKGPFADSEIKNLQIIENQVHKKMNNPEDSSYCSCNVCNTVYQSQQKNKAFMRQTSSSIKIKASKMQEFFKMVSAVNSKIYLHLDISEICFFTKGQPRILFKSNNLGIHRVQMNANNKKSLVDLFISNHRSNNSLQTKKSQNKFQTTRTDAHIKHFNAVIPSFKISDQKQTKKTESYVFHNNPQYDQEPHTNNVRTLQEICMVKYKDKGIELMNQKFLKQLLGSLLALQNVEYIQNYIKPHELHDQLFEATYDSLKPIDNNLMHSRSLTHVKTDINLINKFSRDYVAAQHLQSYQNLLKDIPNDYCLYQTYRMVHYMELVRDIVIDKLDTIWIRDCTQQICFMGLVDFEWHEKKKISVDVGEIQELKELINIQMTDFQQQLMKAWEHMKGRKQKVDQKVEIDEEKQKEIEKIRLQSSMRVQMNSSKKHKKSMPKKV